MTTVGIVYKIGGDYDRKYVKSLVDGVRRNSTSCRIVCLTDDPGLKSIGYDIDDVTRLDYGWSGWWSKMEMFRQPGPFLFFDLDTVIVRSIDPLIEWVESNENFFMMLRGFYKNDLCSGIMAWDGDVSWIFNEFVSTVKRGRFEIRPNAITLRVNNIRYRGDQEWIRLFLGQQTLGRRIVMVQDVFDGVYSYKVHVAENKRLPIDTRVVCFHGRPRPHEVKPVPSWMKIYWFGSIDRMNVPVEKSITTYDRRHDGTLLIVGGSENAMREYSHARSMRPDAMTMTIGHASGFVRSDFVVTDHYEVMLELRRLQDTFGSDDDHYTTHCTFSNRATEYPGIDYWWRWRRSEASSVQTAIRIGLYVGFDEIILCGCPLEHGKIQHPLQIKKDGDDWPPPRDRRKYGSKPGMNTSEEILESFRRHFVQFADDWYGKVFSMSGFTRTVLGPPNFVNGSDLKKQAIKMWSGPTGLRHQYPKRTGTWPDSDSKDIITRLCRGSVCEVGCGTGRCAELFDENGYVGIDINDSAIREARRSYPNHVFKTIEWDDPYPGADTYLFHTVLLHVPDGELIPILLKTMSRDGPNRIVVFESMIRSNRNESKGNYQRDPVEYRYAFESLGRNIIEVIELPSKHKPFIRHYMVAE